MRNEQCSIINGGACGRQFINVQVFSDSSYVVNAVTKGWLWDWVKKDFAKKANPDLWKRFLDIYNKHNVTFNWIKGHAGHPENERCDQLAVAERMKFA